MCLRVPCVCERDIVVVLVCLDVPVVHMVACVCACAFRVCVCVCLCVCVWCICSCVAGCLCVCMRASARMLGVPVLLCLHTNASRRPVFIACVRCTWPTSHKHARHVGLRLRSSLSLSSLLFSSLPSLSLPTPLSFAHSMLHQLEA
jgi:hypothetical protein